MIGGNASSDAVAEIVSTRSFTTTIAPVSGSTASLPLNVSRYTSSTGLVARLVERRQVLGRDDRGERGKGAGNIDPDREEERGELRDGQRLRQRHALREEVDVRLGDRERPGGRRERDEVQAVDLELGFHRIRRRRVGRAHLVLVDEVLAVGIGVEREVDPVGRRPVDDVPRRERVGVVAGDVLDRPPIHDVLVVLRLRELAARVESIFSDTTTFE